MPLGVPGASLLVNILADKRVDRTGGGIIRDGYGTEGSSIKKYV